MNPEVLRTIPKRMITDPAMLGRICWNLSDRLTAGRWNSKFVRGTDFSRSQSERIGYGTMVADTEIDPTFNDTHIDFYASKNSIENDNGRIIDMASYRLMMSVSQSVGEAEVPPHVLDEIFEDQDENDETDSILDGLERDQLQEVEIMREQTVTYEIRDNGEIESYALTYEYTFDDETVHEIHYDSDMGTRITAPIRLAKTGEVVDVRPAILLYLSEAQLETEIKDMDASWLHFIHETTMGEIASFGAQDQYQHRHQALAMIGLLSSGLFTLRELAARK